MEQERITFTPTSSIENDRKMLSQVLSEADLASAPKVEITLSWLPAGGWLAINAALVLILVLWKGDVTEYWKGTLALFWVSSPLSLWSAISALFFFGAPLTFALLPPSAIWRVSSNIEQPWLLTSYSFSSSVVSVLNLMVLTVLIITVFSSRTSCEVLFLALVIPVLSAFLLRNQLHASVAPGVLAHGIRTLLDQNVYEYPRTNGTDWILSALASSISRENLIADFAEDLILAFDDDLRIVAVNPTCIKLLGYAQQELNGTKLDTILIYPTSENLRQMLEPTRSKLNEVGIDLCLITKKQTIVDLIATVQWSSSQSVYFTVARDLTSEKQAKRLREEYLSTVSHDIRTPLLSLSMGATSLSQGYYGELPEQALPAVKRMHRNLDRTIQLLGEMIDLEKTDGKLALQLEQFDVTGAIGEAVEQTQDLSVRLGVSIVTEVPSCEIYADRKRIIRVLTNLISNAIKNSSSNSNVIVSYEHHEHDMEIQVRDTGCGIAEHLQKVIFDRYYQVVSSQSSAVPSSGLGLAICKLFVEAHGGVIGVVSKVNEGSTFWFTLPLRRPKENV